MEAMKREGSVDESAEALEVSKSASLKRQVGSSRLGCEQLPELFKPPETTRSNHLKTLDSIP
jgi:hypothetical protein